FAEFLSDINNSVVGTSTGNTMKVSIYLEHCMRFWPYRCGATGITEYLQAIGIDTKNLQPDRDGLLMMELYVNLLRWAPMQDFNDSRQDVISVSFKKNDVEKESERLIFNAKYILEQCCNMQVREVDGEYDFPQYRIYKRDAVVDDTAEEVPELSDILLGYLDIRNADSREYKEAALTKIYGYLEPRRNELKGLGCGPVSEEFFACMNSFGIRHKTKTQVKIHYSKRNTIYDKLFKMALYVLQTTTIKQLKDEMMKLREK
ncbi:MAG: hypothetical protein IJP92_15425, partial [Lachnospiraceae bacterium]|nr:hypothetical protein [Lachnospiraceae bacterium]